MRWPFCNMNHSGSTLIRKVSLIDFTNLDIDCRVVINFLSSWMIIYIDIKTTELKGYDPSNKLQLRIPHLLRGIIERLRYSLICSVDSLPVQCSVKNWCISNLEVFKHITFWACFRYKALFWSDAQFHRYFVVQNCSAKIGTKETYFYKR